MRRRVARWRRKNRGGSRSSAKTHGTGSSSSPPNSQPPTGPTRALNSRHRWPVAALLGMIRWIASAVKGRTETNAAPVVAPQSPQLPRQTQAQEVRAPQPDRADGVPLPEQSARPMPGAQMAQAIRSVQAARVRLAAAARASGADRAGAAGAAEANRAGARAAQSTRIEAARETRAAQRVRLDSDATPQPVHGAAHWRGQPRRERPRPSPVPYMARWEQAFDAHRAFAEVAVL